MTQPIIIAQTRHIDITTGATTNARTIAIARDRLMDELTQATITAEHDEMTTAIDLATDIATEACPDTTAIIYTTSDQGDWLAVEHVECATHPTHECPANHLDSDLYASHLYLGHIDWLTTECPLSTAPINPPEQRWSLNLTAHRARNH